MLLRSPRLIVLLVLITVLGPLAMQMFLPALPAIQQAFAANAATAQITLTAAMVAMGVANLVFGPLSDRFGRKPVLIAGIAMFVAGSIGAAIAHDITMLIISRVFQAGGASAGIVLARAMARDVFGFAHSLRVISYLTMVMVVAPTVAPVLGGIITDAFGWRAIFWIMVVVGFVALAGVAAAMPETHPGGGPSGWRSLLEGSARLIVNRRYLGYTLVSTASFCLFFSFLAAAPYLTAEVLRRPAMDYGLWFMPVAAVFLIGTFLSTRVVDQFGPDRLIRAGTLVSALIVGVTLPLYYWLPLSMPLLFVPIMAISFVQGFIIPNSQASGINVDPRYVGAGSGLMGFVQMGSGAVAAQGVAMIADATVWPMAYFMSGAALIGVLFLPLMRHNPAPAAPGDGAQH